jgi:hypothetical protein
VLLVKGECNQEQAAEDDHGDDLGLSLNVLLVARQTERQQKQRETTDGKEHAAYIKLNYLVLDSFLKVIVATLLDIDAESLGSA